MMLERINLQNISTYCSTDNKVLPKNKERNVQEKNIINFSYPSNYYTLSFGSNNTKGQDLVPSGIFNYAKQSNNRDLYRMYEKYLSYPVDKREDVLKTCASFYKDKQNALEDFPEFSALCFDDKGNKRMSNFSFLCDLAQKRPDLRESLLAFEYFTDENGKIDNNVIEKANKFLIDENLELADFVTTYQQCTKKDNSFNDRLFNTSIHIFKNKKEIEKTIPPYRVLFLLSSYNDIHSESISKKIELLSEANVLKNKYGDVLDLAGIKINLNIISNRVASSIMGSKDVMKVDEDKALNFASKILFPNPDFEQKLISAQPRMRNMTQGIPLKYSRVDFIKDINSLNDDNAYEKLRVKPRFENGKITGYNGVVSMSDLSEDDPLYKICHKYFYENKSETGDKKLDEIFDTIIEGCPEFLNMAGKFQHGGHEFPLDIHTLLVYSTILDDEEFQKLSKVDKTILKTSAMFHDIEKKEKERDKDHPMASAISAFGIVDRYIKNESSKDRIIGIIKNHEWLGEYQKSKDKTEAAKTAACYFRRSNDYELSKIMTQADMKSVGFLFYFLAGNAIDEDNLKPIEDNVKYLQQTGCAIFSDYPVILKDKNNLIQNFNGVNYKVINFNKIDNETDMGKFGFEPNKKKSDINLLVHMVPNVNPSKELNSLKYLCDSVTGGILSESLISPVGIKRTYKNRSFGVLLSQNNSDVISVNSHNQGSGYKKDGSDFSRLMFTSSRGEYKNRFREFLCKNNSAFSDEEYGEFYKKYLTSKNSLSNFSDSKEYKIGNKTYTGLEIKKALIEIQKNLTRQNPTGHNEIIGYTPKIKGVIGKAQDITEVPKAFLDFAKENNLPVILI